MANSKQKINTITYSSTIATDINTDMDTEAALGFILEKVEMFAGTAFLHYRHENYVAAGVPASLAGLKVATKRITVADLSAVAPSEQIAIPGVPSDAIPIAAIYQLLTEFSGGTVSACTASIGDAGDPNGLLVAQDVFTGAPLTKQHAPGIDITNQTLKTAWAPVIEIVATGDNVSNILGGELFAWVYYIEQPTEAASV